MKQDPLSGPDEVANERFFKGVGLLGLLALEDISNALGLKPRKILLYVEQGIIEPTAPSEGRGIRRRFSLLDLAQFIVVTRLDEIGIKPRRMKSIMKEIRVALTEAKRPLAILLIDANSSGDRIRTFHWGQSYVEAILDGDLAPIVIDWKRVQEQAIQQVSRVNSDPSLGLAVSSPSFFGYPVTDEEADESEVPG